MDRVRPGCPRSSILWDIFKIQPDVKRANWRRNLRLKLLQNISRKKRSRKVIKKILKVKETKESMRCRREEKTTSDE